MQEIVNSWEEYQAKYNRLFKYGLDNNLIRTYDIEFIDNLRKFYYGGIPLSIILLSPKFCDGKCYDCALYATFGMGDDDFRMVDANIDNLRLQPRYALDAKEDPNSANHCFVERTLSDGSIWVYDTTTGLVFARDLYYLMENPQITKINEKKAILDYIEYQDIKCAILDKDKYAIPLILPNLERIAKSSKLYREALEAEIARFKSDIHYDELCREIAEDMRKKRITDNDSEFLENTMRVLRNKGEE